MLTISWGKLGLIFSMPPRARLLRILNFFAAPVTTHHPPYADTMSPFTLLSFKSLPILAFPLAGFARNLWQSQKLKIGAWKKRCNMRAI